MFNQSTVLKILNSGYVSSPLDIRVAFAGHCSKASLLANGEVQLQSEIHSDLLSAMNAVEHAKQSTCTPWQFWTYFNDQRQAWTPLEHLRAQLESDAKRQIRTSDSHPLRIDAVTYPQSTGRIGMTFCPGKQDQGLYGGNWQRDLEKDLKTISEWGTDVLISLVEAKEFVLLGVSDFAQAVKNRSFQWMHLPITDMEIPDAAFETRWNSIRTSLHQRLQQGQSLVIHCRGGLGRTGLLTARILVEADMLPTTAIALVRSTRHHAIETYAQEHYVLTTAWQN